MSLIILLNILVTIIIISEVLACLVMNMNLILSAFAQIACYVFFCYYNMAHYFMLIALALNIVLLVKILYGFGVKYTLTRLGRG